VPKYNSQNHLACLPGKPRVKSGISEWKSFSLFFTLLLSQIFLLFFFVVANQLFPVVVGVFGKIEGFVVGFL
jgi:hypothetical protein